MKTIKRLMLLCIFSITALSCATDDDGNDSGDTSGDDQITANVDGESFTSASISTSATIQSAGGNDSLLILGTNSDGEAIQMTILGFDGEGDYSISPSSAVNAASYIEANVDNPTQTQSWLAPYADGPTGNIDVTSFDGTTIEGTFNFTAQNASDDSLRAITNGAFNINVQ